MKKTIRYTVLIIILFTMPFISSCKENLNEYTFFAMDTYITVTIPAGNYDINNLSQKISEYEKDISRTNEESPVYKFNKNNTDLQTDELQHEIIKKALEISSFTSGAYDITISPVTELWDITGNRQASDENQRIPVEEEIKNTFNNVGYEKLVLDGYSLKKTQPEVEIDFGGIGKGYFCEYTVNYLKENKISYGIVSFGGNIGVFGQKNDGSKWKIGIRDPFITEDIIGYVFIDEGFVSVSGDYERYYEANGIRYHHIFDPKTGYPVWNGVHSVAVISENGAEADALSTAFFVLGYDKTVEIYNKKIYDFEAIFITDDGLFTTAGINDDNFICLK